MKAVTCNVCNAIVDTTYPDYNPNWNWSCFHCSATAQYMLDAAVDSCKQFMACPWEKSRFDRAFPPKQPTDPEWVEDHLAHISNGRSWKVSYNRLEQLIEMGYLNATGVWLTPKGQRRLG